MSQTDRFEQLDTPERWFADLYRNFEPPGAITFCDIDMSRSRDLIALARERGLRLTYSHLVVRAVGLALQRMPEVNCLMENSRRLVCSTVDAAIPVGDTGVRFLPSAMLLRDIGRKNLPAIAAAMEVGAAALRSSEPAEMTALRKAAMLLNRKWIRTGLLRRFLGNAKWKRRHMGTVHISFLKDLDAFVPLAPFVGIVIGAGRVRDKVVAEDGEIQVRPYMTLGCCIDHKIWDGLNLSRFIVQVRRILVEGELITEIEGPAQKQSYAPQYVEAR